MKNTMIFLLSSPLYGTFVLLDLPTGCGLGAEIMVWVWLLISVPHHVYLDLLVAWRPL